MSEVRTWILKNKYDVYSESVIAGKDTIFPELAEKEVRVSEHIHLQKALEEIEALKVNPPGHVELEFQLSAVNKRIKELEEKLLMRIDVEDVHSDVFSRVCEDFDSQIESETHNKKVKNEKA